MPLSRLGVYAPSALAGTVAGTVTNQNTAAPSTARASRARMNRRMLTSRRFNDTPPRRGRDGATHVRTIATRALARRRWLAVRLVASAAGLADVRHRKLELVQRLCLV